MRELTPSLRYALDRCVSTVLRESRSAVAASLLLRAGADGIQHVAAGGIADLPDEGIALVEGA